MLFQNEQDDEGRLCGFQYVLPQNEHDDEEHRDANDESEHDTKHGHHQDP